MNLSSKPLYLITDDQLSLDRLLEKVDIALQSGIHILQYRSKNPNSRVLYEEATALHALCKKYHVPLLINDRLDLAQAVDAEGVHLGQNDLPIFIARKILGSQKIIGATAKNSNQANLAQEEGASYLGVGALFPSPTKPDAISVDLRTLTEIKKSVSIPVYGIGGITQSNLTSELLDQLDGICFVSAVLNSKDIQKTVETFKKFF